MLRKLVVLAMCAGIMLPVLSSADDVALVTPVLQGLGGTTGNQILNHSGVDAPDATFWVLFDFLQCPDYFQFAPSMEYAGTVLAPILEFPSASAPRPAGRSPPAFV